MALSETAVLHEPRCKCNPKPQPLMQETCGGGKQFLDQQK